MNCKGIESFTTRILTVYGCGAAGTIKSKCVHFKNDEKETLQANALRHYQTKVILLIPDTDSNYMLLPICIT